MEAHPGYIEFTSLFFAWLAVPDHSAVTSTVTMTEVLVRPYAMGDQKLADRYHALLATFPHLDWAAPDLPIADRAARLRASYRLRTPDALQAATALESQATGFVTNDAIFKRVAGFETLVLSELVRPA